MSELSKRLAGLSEEQRQLLAARLKARGAAADKQPVRRQPRDGAPLPLSFAQ
jgi:hypothetical protein